MAYLPTNDITTSGSIAANLQNVVLVLNGQSGASVQITGTWVGTITFEGSVDGTNWNPVNAVAASTSIPQSTTVVNGLFRLTPAGLLQLRANMTTYTSGTATLTMRASAGVGGIFANQVVPVTLISNPAEGVVSIINSTTTTLAANGVFTGASEDITNYASVTVSLISDVASATDGLSMQQSANGTNWDWLDVYSIPAAIGKTFGSHVSGKFFRIVYTNGASLQTSFRLQTIHHKHQQPSSVIRPQDGRGNDNDFSEELSHLMGYNGTSWDRLRSSIANGLQIDVTRMPTTAVTGTFFQATQPVSLATNTPDVTDRAARILGVVTPPAIIKNTQGTIGFTIQDLKDAGRNAIHFYTLIPVLTSATDTLQSLTGTKTGATVVATTTPAVVTTGKTLRVTRISGTYIATAASGYGIVRLRFNTAGAVVIGSPIAATLAVGSGTPTTVNAFGSVEAILAEGLEFAAGTGIGISVQGFAAVTATAVGYVLVSVIGYEY